MKGVRPELDPDDIVRRYLDGETMIALCKSFRTDRRRVKLILETRGVTIRGQVQSARAARLIDLPAEPVVTDYRSGMSIHGLAAKYTVDPYVIRRVLTTAGERLRTTAEAIELVRKIHLDTDTVVQRYAAGESVKAIADDLAVHARAVTRTLDMAGVIRRASAEANALTAERRPLETRIAQATRHVITWEGRSILAIPSPHPESAHKRALGRQASLRYQQPDERDVRDLLPDGWIDGQQVVVDRYNLDFTRGTVAVEVHSGGSHPFRSEQTCRRSVDLAERGWHVVYFWPSKASRNRIRADGVAQLVAHVERLDADPSPRRQYLVIRGRGEVVTAGHFDVEHRTLIGRPVDAAQLANRYDTVVAT